MSRSSLVVILSLLVVSAPVSAAEIPTVRLTSTIDVAAPPAAVWSHLTTGKSLVTWCPEWKNAANASIQIAKVGDVLDFTDAWGNGGRSVVTYLAANKELRVAHEPSNGSYVCQAKIVLTPKGAGTSVEYVELYTDESGPADRKATAEKTATAMAATLKALKGQAEKK